jgi:hypothetical protein
VLLLCCRVACWQRRNGNKEMDRITIAFAS